MTFARIAADTIRVRRAAAEVYRPEGVDIFLNASMSLLEGRTPNDVIAAGETDRVLDVIDMLASGAVG